MGTRRLEKLRRRRRMKTRAVDVRREIGAIEPLEERRLMSADELAVGAAFGDGSLEHGAGCGCAGCQTIQTEYGELTVAAALTDDDGNYLYDNLQVDSLPEVLVGAELAAEIEGSGGGELASAGLTVPVLNSNLGASATLFLDFDGHFESSWGGYSNITTAVYDIDGDASSFSSSEVSRITEIWARVAEDFAPFDINVTTVEPGSFANGQALRVAIGGSASDWYGSGAGGVAYINTFTNSIANTVYVFENNLGNGNARYVAEAASHEAGHGFGLRHQSEWNGDQKVSEYWTGENGWAPIMGVGYYQSQTTWYDGRASNGSYQDDLSVLAGSNNGFGYRSDDHGSSNGSASTVSFDGVGNFSVDGIIERNTDTDVFEFNVGAGTLALDVDVAQYGANLDVVLELYNANGQLLTTADPSSMGASITTNLSAGTYFLHVSNDGQYGSLGQYTLSGSAVPGEGDGGGGSVNGPEVSVSYSGGTVSDGQGSAISFGTVSQGATAPTITFTVRNDGDQVLTTSGLSVPSGYTVVDGLSSTIGAGSSDTFTVRLNTNSAGTKSGTISFSTNDSDEGTFNFNVTGTISQAADITVLYNGSNVADGSSTPISLGTADRGASSPSISFTVRNDGQQTLNISSISVPSGYTITASPGSSLAAGASGTLTLRLSTSSVGTFSGEVRIYTNDPDESTFNFVVTGSISPGSDAYENNDSKAQVDAKVAGATNSANLGRLLDTASISGLTMDDSADWFRFEMDGSGSSNDYVRINFSHSAGDLDLVVYEADGVTEVGRSAGTSNSETVSLAGADAGVYYVRVYGYNGASNGSYALTIDPAKSDRAFGGSDKVQFVDADGDTVTVSMRGAGTGEITYDNDGNIASIVVSGSDGGSSIVVKSTGATVVHDVVINGSARTLDMRGVTVTGDITATGSIGKIRIDAMDAATQQTLTIGSDRGGSAFTKIDILSAADVSIVSDIMIKSLKVGSWTDALGDADTITAPSITKLAASGDFAAGLDLDGDRSGYGLKAAKVGGAVSGDWTIGDHVGKLTLGSTTAAFDLEVDGDVKVVKTTGDLAGALEMNCTRSVRVGGVWTANLTANGVDARGFSVKSVKASDMPSGSIVAAGGVGKINVSGDMNASLTAAWVSAIKASGELSGGITLTGEDARGYSVKSIKADAADSADIVAAGGIGKVSVGEWLGDSITAEWIGAVSASGDFETDLTLTGDPDASYALKRVKVGGSLGDAEWDIHGDVGKVIANDADAGFELDATGDVDAVRIDGEFVDTAVLGPALTQIVENAATELDAMFNADDEGESDNTFDPADVLRVV